MNELLFKIYTCDFLFGLPHFRLSLVCFQNIVLNGRNIKNIHDTFDYCRLQPRFESKAIFILTKNEAKPKICFCRLLHTVLFRFSRLTSHRNG